MTCKDCDRRIVCRYYTQWVNVEQVETDRCQYFKNKADVVPVVRCKNCKYRGAMLSVPKGVFYTCKKYLLPYCKPDDYCSYGERKDGETNDR